MQLYWRVVACLQRGNFTLQRSPLDSPCPGLAAAAGRAANLSHEIHLRLDTCVPFAIDGEPARTCLVASLARPRVT
jgi:hypothetical protein